MAGTIKLFHRDAQDFFTNCSVLTLDLHSDYEAAHSIEAILGMMILADYHMLECNKIATKSIQSKVERRPVLQGWGYPIKSGWTRLDII